MLAFTLNRRPDSQEAISTARYVSVTTFRRSGLGVATPVEFIEHGGSLFFRTLPESGKVKRIYREPRVLVAACSMRGKVTGRRRAGTAVLLSPEETAELAPLFSGKYGRIW